MKKICSLLLALSLCTIMCVAAHADQTVHFGKNDEDEVIENEIDEGSEFGESELSQGDEVGSESSDSDFTLEDETEVLPDEELALGDVPEKKDPFVDIDLSPIYGDTMGDLLAGIDDGGISLLADPTPSGSPVSGYKMIVSTSLGTGELFIPKEYAQGCFTFDGSGCLMSTANTTVNGYLVLLNNTYDVRFATFSRPEYYGYDYNNRGSWYDLVISEADSDNVQVMRSDSDAMPWISSELFEAVLLLMMGVIVCRVFMSR